MTVTWHDLANHFCARRKSLGPVPNPLFEECAARRYNFSRSGDTTAIRLVFLRGVLKDAANQTLVRQGRFIWCKNLRYEGKNSESLRLISFTVDKGQKRFIVAENNVLCLPSNSFISNNSFFRNLQKIFGSFASVFCYDKTLRMMMKNSSREWGSLKDFTAHLAADAPYRPGTLVRPRLGYFLPEASRLATKMEELVGLYCAQKFCHDKKSEILGALAQHPGGYISPEIKNDLVGFFEWGAAVPDTTHPYGIIIGRNDGSNSHSGRELYRVRFGNTTYERVHAAQMEIVNEV